VHKVQLHTGSGTNVVTYSLDTVGTDRRTDGPSRTDGKI